MGAMRYAGKALLVVDVQNDFCPGGSLPVPEGDHVVPVLNRWIEAATRLGVPVYASRDWHPEHHISFKDRGGEWPPHCIQGTPGAAFHPELHLPDSATIVSKGTDPDRDAYSAFDGTGLGPLLKRHGIAALYVGGLALDVCVRASVLDARKEGLEVFLIAPAARAITPEGRDATLQHIQEAAATVIQTAEPQLSHPAPS